MNNPILEQNILTLVDKKGVSYVHDELVMKVNRCATLKGLERAKYICEFLIDTLPEGTVAQQKFETLLGQIEAELALL